MIKFVIRKLFGTPNSRHLKQLSKLVDKINLLEPDMQKLSDQDFVSRTDKLKSKVASGASLDSVLVEAFALVREASVRALNMRHYDVQLLGGIALHQGSIAEMSTGEGKTLAATLAVYLNALTEDSVHVVTVNDYLAKRDSEWMRPLYEFLGLNVGYVCSVSDKDQRKQAYSCDVVYVTNTEIAFDFLRDNMVVRTEDKVQRGLCFVIVDEADSVLVDNARTPVVISGSEDHDVTIYNTINNIVTSFNPQKEEDKIDGDFKIDEKHRQVFLTDLGHSKAEEELRKHKLISEGDTLYDANNIIFIHYLNACLRANFLYEKDVDYMIKDNAIVIIDEHSGRAMPGRRWGDGLHQAIESKEGIEIQQESHSLATITFQNFFRQYDKISGMTGTAETEAHELEEVYGLSVVVIPSNKTVIRVDNSDLVFLRKQKKYEYVVKTVVERHKKGQPVLVGTVSIDDSELISSMLKRENIDHNVLNAKYHEKEAHIIANAGRKFAVTIATNMAGRGTDIVLGGNMDVEISNAKSDAEKENINQECQKEHQEVVALGGLFIIGTERHESRRIDNQLRGRSGRQGDPGETQFYLSLEDGLMRIFASDKVREFMKRLGMGEGDTISAPMLTRAIENAQRKVEGHNFDIRKQLLQFDDISNDQRKVIYSQRNELLAIDDLAEIIREMRVKVVNQTILDYAPEDTLEEEWDLFGLEACLTEEFGIHLPLKDIFAKDDTFHRNSLEQTILNTMVDSYDIKEHQIGSEGMREFEKFMMLKIIDMQWKDHLATLDYLRQGIHLRGYANKNPIQEYKSEAFDIFTTMLDNIKFETIKKLQIVRISNNNRTTSNAIEVNPLIASPLC